MVQMFVLLSHCASLVVRLLVENDTHVEMLEWVVCRKDLDPCK